MSSTSANSENPVAVPRPSASLIVVNERNEILLVHRNPKARSFGGMTVFPGGNYDKKQDTTLAVTAIRETFEETGLLLVSSDEPSTTAPLDDAQLEDARHRIHQQKLLWQEFLDSRRLRLDVSALLPFTQWITPKEAPRRFHTQFFITFLPATPSTGFNSGAKHEHIPKTDGGQEVISTRFVHPSAILREFHDGKITLLPPQFYLLTTLVDVLQGVSNTEKQRMRVEHISRSNFGRMTFNPRPLKTEGEDRVQGQLILTYEGDETRGGSPGRLHRANLRMANGLIREIVLQRNFDIYDNVDSHAHNFSQSSKL
ncbi:hypothetical protein AGABI2DRAFT_64679 [Agaricus bisporus var. bisporus H97]|uniref:hypothetical protein n=1 Tax=Agaricus bisporus var. bisporus (strain H97 / ATCC MYA-4626 / FGSC 10389) TaxID=936046 RepID=UPI00029F4F35|nr:hypothetical protein AGABI2DRAFT_64679 [Agaricus bisporus var. bisporus H97]EKV49964.1 hypothetical protein AGABI2DRAFT_64679 [Agaricus bisporus var. bisporus H97]